MIYLGELNLLHAYRQTDNGIYLIDDEENEVLLPNKYIPEGMKMGDEIEVFIYKDSEDRLIATNLTPNIMLDEYAGLKVKSLTNVGAFLDWGLEKDLLVPHAELQDIVKEGQLLAVYCYLDETTDRLAATTRIHRHMNREKVDLEVGQEVVAFIVEKAEVGYSVMVNEEYQGMLFYNQIFKDIKIGDKVKAYVKQIRDDNKVDLSLEKFGYKAVDDNVAKLYKALEANGGSLPLHDKSDPEEIKNRLGMSKKIFKKSIGALYRDKIIVIKDDGIQLI